MGRIRRARNDDVEALAHILREAYRPEAERTGDPGVLERVASHDKVKELIAQEETYVLEEGGHIVATATLQPLAYLRRIATVPSEQGKGHASRLVEHLLSRAERTGYSVVGLDTDAELPWVEEWYRHYGLETVAEARYLASNFRTRYMEKKLRSKQKSGD